MLCRLYGAWLPGALVVKILLKAERIIGAVNNSGRPNTLELGLWLSFHYLIGREIGHLPNTHLITLDGRVRFEEDRVFFHRLEIFNLRSIETAPIDSPLPKGWSWQTRGALEPRDLSCQVCFM